MTPQLNKPGILSRLKSAFTSRREAKAEVNAQDSALHLKQMYETFRSILACNDATLQLIADVEDRLSGKTSFSFNSMVRRLRKGILDVYIMVRDFNEIAWGRYLDLFDALRKVNRDFEANLASFSNLATGPLIIPLSNLHATEASVVGDKMANLGEIRNVIGLNVPEGFAITSTAFARFMDREELRNRADKLEELTETFGPRVVGEACLEVQQKISAAPLPPELEEGIMNAYLAMATDPEDLMAVRSSGIGEDREASHAGLYSTELNVNSTSLLEAYKRVLASAYGAGPVQYRLKYGLANTGALMAVGVIRMVKSRCQGVMFSRSFDDREADQVVISAYSGPAGVESQVESHLEDVIVAAGEIEVAGSLQCLSKMDVITLAETARTLETHFGAPQDVEWAISVDDKLFILQSRPMVFIEKPVETNTVERVWDSEPILAGGVTAFPGIASGPVFIVQSENDLDRFPAGAVLVSHSSSPRYSLVMDRCAAIITDEGSAIGHMAILAREFRVPTIVGLKDASGRLTEGSEITVDAGGRKVYSGLHSPPAPQEEAAALINAPAVLKLKRIAQYITPLRLIDATSPEFTPAHVNSLHDVIRFIHEKIFQVMFYFGDRALAMDPSSVSLEENLPFKVLIFDVGGGLSEGVGSSGRITLSDVVSPPLKSFLEGLSDRRISWDEPRAISAGGFLSVLGENIAGLPAEELGVGRPSFAVVSDRYMNFSTKAGYHFNTVDTYCSQNLNKNYIHFRFEGGAADETRRERRCRFISIVLESLNFKVQCHGDVLVGRIEKREREVIVKLLLQLGQLTLCCRQLDMLMRSDSSPDFFAQAFLAGELERF
jgi:pyruvate, water dikinase